MTKIDEVISCLYMASEIIDTEIEWNVDKGRDVDLADAMQGVSDAMDILRCLQDERFDVLEENYDISLMGV